MQKLGFRKLYVKEVFYYLRKKFKADNTGQKTDVSNDKNPENDINSDITDCVIGNCTFI